MISEDAKHNVVTNPYKDLLAYTNTIGPSVCLENVSVTMQKTDILKNINLIFEAGKTTAIIGSNGSGKSTLLKALLGQYSHLGNIQIHWQGKASSHISYVPQHIDFDREIPMNASDFLGMLLQSKPIFLGMDKKYKIIIHHLLKEVSMFTHRYTKIGKLSGGELKRILFIQALYPEPGLILLDEPLAALDEPGIVIFSNILKQLQAMGKTIIWVEHDLLAVKKMAHYFVALNKEVLQTGNASDLSDADLLMRIFSNVSLADETADTTI